jgi:stage V sporulation protein SpoVS
MEVLKVAASSDANSVARAIVGALRKAQLVETHAIGAGAVNQAVKAVAIARRSLQRESRDLVMTPGFIEVEVDGQERTGVRLIIEIFEQKT